ncbi:MAG TPA: AAA family ATPase [Pseudonocardiaceae bacterium]|jgi:DNA-binding CsgD family transcriptional regulator|nr:AAA family ATPase [Pseudonocardiaceae bacterium]
MDLVPRLGSGIPLVARAAEMARLRASLARAEAGAAGAVLVSGDAGVGKSRLLAELGQYAEARDVLVLSGRCLDVGETGLPYLPFVEVLVQLNRQDPAAVRHWPALARLLPESIMPATPEPASYSPRPGSPTAAPERDLGQLQLFDALIGLLTDLSSRRCVLLLVEDLHWADQSTRDLVSFLLSRLRAQRLLVVASYRSDDLYRRHPLRPLLAELVRLPAVERIDLTPFDMDDSRKFVAALADGPLSDDLVRQIAERSEGNAFFAEELMAACAEHEDGVPTGLADVLLARIERLAPATQTVVRLASVAGRRVRHSRLQAVANVGPLELDEALREAVQHHVLLVDDGADVYAFRHALLREAVYGDLLPGERVRLHADYAKHIATEEGRRGVAAALAHHSLQSHDLRTALLASVRAADDAASLGAPAEALRHVEQALKLWDGVDAADRPTGISEAVLLRRASYAAGTAGEPERAVAYARSAVDRFAAVEEPESAAQSYRRLAQALIGMDNKGAEAREAIENAWALVAKRPPSYTRAWVQAVLAMALRRSDPAAAKVAAADAIADARAVRALGAEADALITLGMLEEHDGNAEQAVSHFKEAVDTAVRVDAFSTELRARFFLGLHRYDHGDLTGAVAEFDEGSARARANGMTWSSYGIDIRIYQAISKYMVGDWDGSAAAAEAPGKRMSDTVLARLASASAFVMVGRGQYDEAEKLLTELRAHWHRDGDIVLYGGYAAAELGLWRGRPEHTAAVVEDVSTLLAKASWTWMLCRIRLDAWGIAAQVELARRARRERDVGAELAAVAEGERLADDAEEVATIGRPWTGSMGAEGLAWLAVVRAERTRLAGPGDPAAWRAAVEAFDYGSVYEQAIARLRLAETLLAGDNRAERAAEATVELSEVVAVAGRLGARPLSEAAAELARRGRLTVDGLAAVRDEVDPFTPRERAVLTLVALGRTNRQVGQELYISEKTVSVHLSRIMAKLGASRRAEAVATAYERGLLAPHGS